MWMLTTFSCSHNCAHHRLCNKSAAQSRRTRLLINKCPEANSKYFRISSAGAPDRKLNNLAYLRARSAACRCAFKSCEMSSQASITVGSLTPCGPFHRKPTNAAGAFGSSSTIVRSRFLVGSVGSRRRFRFNLLVTATQ